jgi:hypothetical protein
MPKQKASKARLRPFPADSSCPCGSGTIYRDCCIRKKFRFKVDKDGNVIRQLKIHPRLKPELENALLEFKEMFGPSPAAAIQYCLANTSLERMIFGSRPKLSDELRGFVKN